ncbi:MAG: tetratricopeptide repeat protein [Planctomycetota bacterium]|jgi:tetratricopeptide (TPR) repeat protein
MKKQAQPQKSAPPPEEAGQSAQQAESNLHLDNIAQAFAAGDYAKAVLRASEALNAEPDDPVLPFVYAQSLFANQQYSEAAGVLREALRKVDIEKNGVYYSAGFYPDQAVLTEQIKKLTEAVKADSYNADLQLLLGYQFLGVGRYDEVLKALQTAEPDYVNKEAAGILMQVLEKARPASPKEAPKTAPKY